VCVLTAFLALLHAEPALAHADLVKSELAGSSSPAGSPAEMVFHFSEDIEPGFSRVQILDNQGQVVDPGPGTVDAADSTVLSIPLDRLPAGSYLAALRVRAQDGHYTEFRVPFNLGPGVSAIVGLPPLGEPDPALLLPPFIDTVLRWLLLLGVAAAGGATAFALLVWRPVWREREGGQSAPVEPQAWGEAIGVGLRRLVFVGAVVVVVAGTLLLVNQAAKGENVSWLRAVGGPVWHDLATRSGRMWMLRSGCALLLLAISRYLPSSPRAGSAPWWAAAMATGGMLAAFSLGGHAAEVRGQAGVAVLLDGVHLLATVVWIGGLGSLVLAGLVAGATEAARPLQPALASRFSGVALACVAYLGVSGLYAYSLQVRSFVPLTATTYGRVLLVKLGLFAVLILLGAVNRVFLIPRMGPTADEKTEARADRAARHFAWAIRAEVLVGVAVLFAVAVMTSLAPAATAWAAHERLGPAMPADVGLVHMVLRLAPGDIGDNFLAVDVLDRRGGAASAPAHVVVKLVGSPASTTLLASDRGAGGLERYQMSGFPLTSAGLVGFDVTLLREGFNPVRHVFTMTAGAGAR
jgi:copper transport protein